MFALFWYVLEGFRQVLVDFKRLLELPGAARVRILHDTVAIFMKSSGFSVLFTKGSKADKLSFAHACESSVFFLTVSKAIFPNFEL